MAFESNFSAFENAIKEGKERAAAAAGDFGPRLNYFSWKDKEVKIVRFLVEPIAGEFAEWVITNDGKSADFLLNPEGTNWVQHFGGKSRERGLTGAIVDPKIAKRGVSVAVLRDDRPVQGTGRMEVFDAENSFESKRDGKTYQSRYFGLIKQSFGNFWEQLIGIGRRNGTICDRDFEIRRVGADMTTKYDISPIDPIEELRDPEVVRQFYGYGRPRNDQDPDRYLYCPMTLSEWCEYYSGEERATRLLAPKAGGVIPQQPVFQSPTVMAYPPQQTVSPVGLNPNPVVASVVAPPVQGGSWAGADDEAQAVPSASSAFADMRAKLIPHLNK